ncbi:MAG: PEP-CTERM sorting domain-containing protein [Rubrivivax sp.]|nr:PEP-CTERM sorting domain-containing protein [Rubrivivax sp.]
MQMQALFRGALALTAVATVMAAAPAHAVLVYSGPVSIAIPDDIDGVYVNLVTGASGATGGSAPGWDINPYSALAGQFNLWGFTTTTWLSPSGVIGGPYPLAAGTSIDAAGTFFRPGGGTDVGTQVTLNAANLFGVRFTNEALGNAINFGWVEITFGASAAERSITGWAYENSGGAILANAVPEPGTYAMMLAGLAAIGGLVARRRQA